MLKLYQYSKCGTCIKAKKWVASKSLDVELVDIRETPPSIEELTLALSCYQGELKRLFNTSGMDYRRLNIKEKLSSMSTDQALALLASNGNLVKRPFLVQDNHSVLVGFNEELWCKNIVN